MSSSAREELLSAVLNINPASMSFDNGLGLSAAKRAEDKRPLSKRNEAGFTPSNPSDFIYKNPYTYLAMTNTIEDNQIPGVLIKRLKTNKDERGFFREVIRFSDPFFAEASNFGQWSHSRMIKDVVKAWHYHHVQTDWWYVGVGLCEAVLIDHREESPTYGKKLVFNMGELNSGDNGEHAICVKIPPGVLHACKVLSEEAHLFYITSHLYNPNDEGRFPFDAGPVPHVWGPNALVVDNDKRTFVPTATRAQFK